MFRIITAIIILVLTGWFFLALRSRKGLLRLSASTLIAGTKASLGKMINFRSLSSSDIIRYMKILTYFIILICVLLLALTGFIPYIVSGATLTGFSLIIHVTVSPVFAVCFTILVLLEVRNQRFNETDLFVFTNNSAQNSNTKTGTVSKTCFWLMVVLSPVIMGSIILSMYPVFGTAGQKILMILHYTGALLFLAAGIIHTVQLINLLLILPRNKFPRNE